MDCLRYLLVRGKAPPGELGPDRPVEPNGFLLSPRTRNLYGTLPAPPAASITRMAQYLRAQSADLAAQSEASILCGEVRFGPLEETGAEGFRKPDLD